MNFDNLNNIEDSIDNEDNDLTEDQKIIQLLNNKITFTFANVGERIDMDKTINKEIKYINKTLYMLISDINNIKYVLNSFDASRCSERASDNKKIILNNINYLSLEDK